MVWRVWGLWEALRGISEAQTIFVLILSHYWTFLLSFSHKVQQNFLMCIREIYMTQWTDIFQMTNALCYKIVIYSFKMHDGAICISVREYNKSTDIVVDPYCNSVFRIYRLFSFDISKYIQNYVYKVLNYPFSNNLFVRGQLFFIYFNRNNIS